MKKYLLILCALFCCAMLGTAQAPPHLKGPAAKNYKPWSKKYQKPSVFVHSVKTNSRYKGIEAKNQKRWLQQTKPMQVATRNRPHLKGPAAKNWKPWQTKREKELGAVAEELKKKQETRASKLVRDQL